MAPTGTDLPDPVVRRATSADVSELQRLLTLADNELTGRKGAWLWARRDARFPSITDAATQLVEAPWITMLGTFDGAVVGFAFGIIEPLHQVNSSGVDSSGVDSSQPTGPLGVIHGLYVETDGRDVSVGDALVLALLDEFRTAGCVGADAWALPGERETKNFYEAHGFSARSITVHHSFIGPTHESRTDAIRASMSDSDTADRPHGS
jgi:GNAT superfamily N-acetyltransferase